MTKMVFIKAKGIDFGSLPLKKVFNKKQSIDVIV